MPAPIRGRPSPAAARLGKPLAHTVFVPDDGVAFGNRGSTSGTTHERRLLAQTFQASSGRKTGEATRTADERPLSVVSMGRFSRAATLNGESGSENEHSIRRRPSCVAASRDPNLAEGSMGWIVNASTTSHACWPRRQAAGRSFVGSDRRCRPRTHGGSARCPGARWPGLLHGRGLPSGLMLPARQLLRRGNRRGVHRERECCSGTCYLGECVTCSLESGSCDTDGDCCGDLLCDDQVCSSCLPVDSDCDVDGDCCSEACDELYGSCCEPEDPLRHLRRGRVWLEALTTAAS